MKLSIGELLHGRSGAWSTIFSKSHKKQTQHCRAGEIRLKLDRNSVELHKTRLQTRRCSIENSGMAAAAACEELHSVVPRQDSITLAKRRMSHDVHVGADTAAAADESSPASTAAPAGGWHITADQAASTA